MIQDDNGYSYKLVDGIIISKLNDFFEIGKPIRSVNKPYILEEEHLKIEVGKFYKTRDGRKAWVVSRQENEHYPYIIAVLGKVDAYAVTKDGRFYDDRPYAYDIIGPWEK